MITDPIPCPYTYAGGRKCKGHIVSIEAFKADLVWSLKDGVWLFSVEQPRSHYHLRCSDKGTHAGCGQEDRLKFYYDQLPPSLQTVISQTKSS